MPPELFRGASKSPQKPYESLQEARSAYEREFVLRKLEENRWNMTKAAEALGLERSHLVPEDAALGIAPAKPKAGNESLASEGPSSRILTAEPTFARILIVVGNVGGGQFLALAEVFELAVPVELPNDV